ncbi:MAG: phosphatase PAP2 family protein [Prevotella sp.]|nr:phosphatase PAP2 family protein [Prevotella sp.]
MGQDFSYMADSVPAERFRVRQLILPTSLIAVGTFGVYNGWFGSVRTDLRNDIGHMRGNCYFHADDYLQYLPVAANVTMGMLGVKSRHSLKERLAVTATAYIAMGIIVNAGKYTVKERRPDSSARNSFPSGHTATAFMGAELVREEYGGICGWSAYAVATGIAALRLYNERHWLNDVIAGAGVGILSARIGYWLLPAERHLFGWHDSNVAILPVVNTSGYYGIAMNIEF